MTSRFANALQGEQANLQSGETHKLQHFSGHSATLLNRVGQAAAASF